MNSVSVHWMRRSHALKVYVNLKFHGLVMAVERKLHLHDFSRYPVIISLCILHIVICILDFGSIINMETMPSSAGQLFLLDIPHFIEPVLDGI